MARKPALADCPCSQGSYASCCGRFIDNGNIPATALELMRSRYTAFVLRNAHYLKATWHPDTLPEDVISEDDVKWTGLTILNHHHDIQDDIATVEFIARFKVGGRAHRIHEISHFERMFDAAGQHRWYYVDGTFPEET